MITQQELFTVEEAAKWCNLTRNAFYMHYKRGHIDSVDMPTHRLYFTREQIDTFRANYVPFN